MSKYTDAVEANLKGLNAVSTGVCPGCDECRDQYNDYAVEEAGPPWDDEGPEDSYQVPAIPGRYFMSQEEAEAAARQAFEDAWSNGQIIEEPSFSWSGCGICGSHLGGNRESWHGIDTDGKILHFDDACVDCVVYLANGEEPDSDHP